MPYTITRMVAGLIIKPFIKEVCGLENVPKNRAFIIAANHQSYLDHLIIGHYLIGRINKKIRFLAKKEHFRGFLEKRWHDFVGAIPVDRESGGKEALEYAKKALRNGKVIMIYPEGTRTLTGRMQKGKTGVARLALAAKVPVLPIGINGTFKILPKGKRIPKPNKATMNIGRLMYFDSYYGKENNKKDVRKVTDIIMKEIARLARQKYEY